MTTDHGTGVSMSPQPPQDGRWTIFAPASYKNMAFGEAQLVVGVRAAGLLLKELLFIEERHNQPVRGACRSGTGRVFARIRSGRVITAHCPANGHQSPLSG
jgi:hypothetical protein